MDPATLSSLIGVGGQLLGGLFGRKKEKTISAGDNAYSHVDGIMRAAAKFGFSPLTLLGSVGQMGGTPGYTDNTAIGTAVANAAMLASDAIAAKAKTADKLNKYQQDNQRLTERLNAISIRPPTPNRYGRSPMPSDPEVYGNAASDQSTDGLLPAGATDPTGRPLPDVDRGVLADSRRAVDNSDVKSHPGYILIDNPSLPLPARVLTLDGDEPLHWYDYPDLVLPSITMGMDVINRSQDRKEVAWPEADAATILKAERRVKAERDAAKRKNAKYFGRSSYGMPKAYKLTAMGWQ